MIAHVYHVQLPIQLAQDMTLSPDLPKDLSQLQNLHALYDYLTFYEKFCLASTFKSQIWCIMSDY